MERLLLIALGTLVSEDLACIAAGLLVASGSVSFAGAAFASTAGILGGDLLLYFAGRFLGHSLLRCRLVSSRLRLSDLERSKRWLTERGPVVVLLSRFTPGLRLPTYLAAGVLRTGAARFALWTLMACALWAPALVGVSATLGEAAARGFLHWLAPLLAIAWLIWLLRVLPRDRTRRRLVGLLRRMARWEFWPAWLAYIPVGFYVLFLMIRHRSMTLFTAANPGISTGGLTGESKDAILNSIPREFAARHVRIHKELAPYARLHRVDEFLGANHLGLPIVLKPDVGERGRDVSVVRTREQLEGLLAAATVDLIAQEYVGGLEFGVFYARHPESSHGSIVSITRKVLPELTGDGASTLEDLVLRDERAVCLTAAYRTANQSRWHDVPAAGERVQLVEVGSHCRGAVFLDGRHLVTPALEASIDQISRTVPGFYFGRFDVRAGSVEAFQAGSFRVLELNGVASEPAHIYDPAVKLPEAYRTMFWQWRTAFEYGAANRRRGVSPMPLRELIAAIHGISGTGACRRSGVSATPAME